MLVLSEFEFRWIPFAKFDAQGWNTGCAYDRYTDEQIRLAEAAPDVRADWRRYVTDSPPPSWNAFHLGRIKAIALEIESGKPVRPVKAYFYPNSTCNCIGDGHHRLRALRFVGAEAFPAIVTGTPELIEKLFR